MIHLQILGKVDHLEDIFWLKTIYSHNKRPFSTTVSDDLPINVCKTLDCLENIFWLKTINGRNARLFSGIICDGPACLLSLLVV